jgi:hypothetical protein
MWTGICAHREVTGGYSEKAVTYKTMTCKFMKCFIFNKKERKKKNWCCEGGPFSGPKQSAV